MYLFRTISEELDGLSRAQYGELFGEIISDPFQTSVAKNDAKKRQSATWLIGILIFIVGIPSCLSFGVSADFKVFNRTIFDIADFTVSNVLMPLGALLISLFVSLKIAKDVLFAELRQGSTISKLFFDIWFFLIRYVAPIAILIVFLDVIGFLDFLK